MARENVEVAVSPRLAGGNALKDDVSGGERTGGEQGGKTLGHLHLAWRASEGEAGAPCPTCGPQALGRSLSRL